MCIGFELTCVDAYADALLDRVIHNAHRLELTGESQRKKTLVQGEEVG